MFEDLVKQANSIMRNRVRKEWEVIDGILGFKGLAGRVAPTAEEIYSAIFENKYSDTVTFDDSNLLVGMINFSRYPVSLSIHLKSLSENSSSINISIVASVENGDQHSVAWNLDADHIVINNTWYPFMPGSSDEIQAVLESVGISEVGDIGFGQYLLLLKSGSELIQDMVQRIVPDISVVNQREKPDSLKAELYLYQRKGWQWLCFMRYERMGGILADEMGLGKTIQIIALLVTEEKGVVFPSLIVCPNTLLENWRREFEKFAPHVSVNVHQGPRRTGFPFQLRSYDVVIASYDTVVRDNSLFTQIDWKVVVCDEAQAIKNSETRRANAVRRIPRQTGFAVTGTPVENRLSDLWSIMEFALPGFLGSKSSFEKNFENPIDGASRLEKLVSPLILRRRVSEVARDLPSKIVIPQLVELSSSEIEQYERIRKETAREFEGNASLVVLIRLRMFCTHPFLLSRVYGEDPALYSNKYTRLAEITEEVVENGSKLLIFTSYSSMIDMIVDDFSHRFGIYCRSIDGRTPTGDRQKLVDEFSRYHGPAALVLNPIAAGAGLNITAANHVIHYNLEWNPAKEDQASARAYRRGQDRPVTIHRLIYANTIDEVIDERLQRKRELSGTAIVGVRGNDDDYPDILKAISRSPRTRE
jgi:SNF2 family DNA or RNA helicase